MISFTFFLSLLLLLIILKLLLHRSPLILLLNKWQDHVHPHQFFKVPEYNDHLQPNRFYQQVSTYINSLISSIDHHSDFTNLHSGKCSGDILLSLDDNQLVNDTFHGATISWKNEILRHQNQNQKTKTFILKIKPKDKHRILRTYLQHICSISNEIEQKYRQIKLYINAADHHHQSRWKSIPFDHPASMETIVMDADLKNKIISQLHSFRKSKHYYHRLGRVWKRSYLLYGPSGTGKSSFVAAMAKFLNYDVYDVDLSRVDDDSDLKLLLLQTKSKSLIVMEDLDRFVTNDNINFLLNFMDGIVNWCSGDEKIMVFTMNSIDAAMLRPGTIDLHIHFPLCNFRSFKSLAISYLGIKAHKLFPQVEEIFLTGAKMSPAEIGEIMIMNRSSPSRALKTVIAALRSNDESRKIGRRLVVDGGEEAEEGGGISRKDVGSPGRKLRKLVGILRMKSGK